MPRDLSAFFCPKSIAIVGASRSPEKVGAILLKNIVSSKFPGKVYPINPNTDKIGELPVFKDVNSLPEVPDLALIAIPASGVLEALTQIGEKGIKQVVVFSAGFKEMGVEGAKLETDLAALAQKYQINLLGPNCLGFVNNLVPLNATFGEVLSQPGNLRFISQSGAIAASLFDWCGSTGLGFGEFITLGNKADLSENDFLQYYLDHPQVTLSPVDQEGLSNVFPIGLYLESIVKGAEFLRLAGQISKTNPVFIIKPGKTAAAAKAMQSHTGAIAGEDAILEAVLKQDGLIRVATLEDFFDLARAFAWENAPAGPKVAIISNAGGPAVISADAVAESGLELAEMNEQTRDKLLQILPRSASVLNPVDVLGDALADRIAKAAEIVLQNEQVNSLVVILTPQVMTQIEQTAESIGNLSKIYHKPIFCSFIGGSLVAEGEKVLNKFRIPSFRFPERAMAAIGVMWRWNQNRQQESKSEAVAPAELPNQTQISQVLEQACSNQQKTLDNLQANTIVAAAGIPTPPTQIVTDIAQAESFAQKYGYPVVLKLSSPGLLHKKDIGGVVTDINNSTHMERAWDSLKQKIGNLEDGVKSKVQIQIQKEILDGVEVIVGVKRDSTFGKVLLFGAGGSLAELIADRNLQLLPVDLPGAKRLVQQSKIYSLLKGSENEPPFALDALYQSVISLGNLAQSADQISDIEINPLLVTLNGVWAADAKVILQPQESQPANLPKFQVATTMTHKVLATTYHYLEFESPTPLIFKPGQYISVKVAQNRINCYSLVGQEGNKFSLLVDISPGGPGSKFFENLQIGDKIAYLGPFGTFTLNLDDGATHRLFLATGCGLSPIRAMIDAALKQYHTSSYITLYLSMKTPIDLFWLDYFQKLAEEYPNFNFKISVDTPNEKWQGHTGFITKLLEEDFRDARGCAAYLCGSKPMMNSATEILVNNGCPKERIYTEKY